RCSRDWSSDVCSSDLPVIRPVLLAVCFALIGNPLIRGLQRLYVPRVVGALLVLMAGLAGTALLANQLVAPAAEWARQVPREIRKVAPPLREMTRPVQAAHAAAADLARAAAGGPPGAAVRP